MFVRFFLLKNNLIFAIRGGLWYVIFTVWYPFKSKFLIEWPVNSVDFLIYPYQTLFTGFSIFKESKIMRTKVIKEFPDYSISDTGRIFNVKFNREVHPWKDCWGYLQVQLKKKHRKIHRLVGIYFVQNSNPEKFKQINHLNGIKLDNNFQNLEWTDYSGNITHAYRTGLNKNIGGTHYRARLNEKQVYKICKLLEQGIGSTDIAKGLGDVSLKESIQFIKSRTSWGHISKDYIFPTLISYKIRLNEDQVHEVCKKLEKGMGAAEIAKSLGDSTLREAIQQIKGRYYWKNISKLYNIPKVKRNKRLTDIQVHKICSLFEKGLGAAKIAEFFRDRTLIPVIQAIKCRRSWLDISCNYNF